MSVLAAEGLPAACISKVWDWSECDFGGRPVVWPLMLVVALSLDACHLQHYPNRAGWIANFCLVPNWAQISENYNCYAAAGGVPDTSETPMLTLYP